MPADLSEALAMDWPATVRRGWGYGSLRSGQALPIEQVVAQLGPSFGANGQGPLITARGVKDAAPDEPFNQLGALGWHSDFSARRVRPRWTLSRVVQGDEAGSGAWRVAEVGVLLARLDVADRAALQVPWPFAFLPWDDPGLFIPLEGEGLRYWGRSMCFGLERVAPQERALRLRVIAAVEAAADACATELPAVTGAVFLVDNFRVLHDRLAQRAGARVAELYFFGEGSHDDE